MYASRLCALHPLLVFIIKEATTLSPSNSEETDPRIDRMDIERTQTSRTIDSQPKPRSRKLFPSISVRPFATALNAIAAVEPKTTASHRSLSTISLPPRTDMVGETMEGPLAAEHMELESFSRLRQSPKTSFTRVIDFYPFSIASS